MSCSSAAAISEATTDIHYVAWKSNFVADCLLHVLVRPVQLGMDFSAIAADHPSNPGLLTLRSTHTGLMPEDAVMQESSPGLLCSLPLTPWSSGISEVDRFLVRLAWTVQGRQGVGCCMYGMQVCYGPPEH